MSRTERLFELIQFLRRHRYPVRGAVLAEEMGVSLRTVYRDIATLQTQGAHIEGEPGLGYVLRPGFMLPPLMFTEEEIEAIVLGSRWVVDKADADLSQAATNVLAKISSVIPASLRIQLDASGLLIGPGKVANGKDADLRILRKAMRNEHKVQLTYTDQKQDESKRTVWPLAIGYFDEIRILVAWCELREDFRHFRVDRIQDLALCNTRYEERRETLLKKWRKQNNIPSRN